MKTFEITFVRDGSWLWAYHGAIELCSIGLEELWDFAGYNRVTVRVSSRRSREAYEFEVIDGPYGLLPGLALGGTRIDTTRSASCELRDRGLKVGDTIYVTLFLG